MTDCQSGQQFDPSGPMRAFFRRSCERLPALRTHILFWSVAAITLALDLLSKWAVFQWLKGRSYIFVIDGVVRLVMVYNDGAAFGLFAGHPNWLIVVSFVALAVVLCVFLFGGSREKMMNIAMAFFAAGICGNLYDRIFNNGLVRDFIDVGVTDGLRWPAFNLADSLLCISVGLMIMSVCITDRPCRKRALQQK